MSRLMLLARSGQNDIASGFNLLLGMNTGASGLSWRLVLSAGYSWLLGKKEGALGLSFGRVLGTNTGASGLRGVEVVDTGVAVGQGLW